MDINSLPAGAVVVAYDGSSHADRALEWGAQVAAREHRTLIIAHAVEAVRWYAGSTLGAEVATIAKAVTEAGEALVATAVATVGETHPEVAVETVCESADARDLLVDLSQRSQLLVVGSRGRGPVRSLLLGSVAVAVTRHAACPVVVLRPDSEDSGGGGVVVGVDATEESHATLEFAFRAASWRRTSLTVLYCFWDVDRVEDGVLIADDDQEYVEERALLSQAVAGLRETYPDVEVEQRLARGLVDRVLVDQAHGRDLLVVGARTHNALGEALLGSVATTMVEYAPCPVAVVPRADSAELG